MVKTSMPAAPPKYSNIDEYVQAPGNTSKSWPRVQDTGDFAELKHVPTCNSCFVGLDVGSALALVLVLVLVVLLTLGEREGAELSNFSGP